MSMILCLRCGTYNDSQLIMCTKCGQRLNNPDVHTPALQLRVEEVTARLRQITIACDWYKNETLSLEEFADFLKLWGASLKREKPRSLMIDDDAEENEPDTTVEVELDPNFAHFSEGLDIIYPILQDGDLDRLDRGLKVMKEGCLQILGMKPDDIGQITEDTAKEVTCVVCGSKNVAQDSLCTSCGAKLPRATAIAAELVHKPLTGRMEQFKQACWRVQNKNWTLKEFGEFLENMQDTLKAKREVYLTALGDYGQFAGEEVEVAKAGMDDYEAGMEEFWTYIESKDATSLQRGLELVASGNDKINKAMALNRSTRSELADEFGYV